LVVDAYLHLRKTPAKFGAKRFESCVHRSGDLLVY
jgi:hypothetical protein